MLGYIQAERSSDLWTKSECIGWECTRLDDGAFAWMYGDLYQCQQVDNIPTWKHINTGDYF